MKQKFPHNDSPENRSWRRLNDPYQINLFDENIKERSVKNMTNEGNKPVFSFKSGAVKGSVWKNTKVVDGNERVWYSCKIVRAYKDGEDWKETSNYNMRDLPDVELVSWECYKWIRVEG